MAAAVKVWGPLILGFVAGGFGFSELYFVEEHYRDVFEVLSDFAIILAAVAYVLGGINVVQVNYPKIRRRDADWQYKVLLLASAALMFVVGIYPWHKLGNPADGGTVVVSAASAATQPGPGKARLVVRTTREHAVVTLDADVPLRAWHAGSPDKNQPPGDRALSIDIEPGRHNIAIAMPVDGFEQYKAEFDAAAGQQVTVDTDLDMLWGAQTPGEGRVYKWLYDFVFAPCNATMFALLAFFIASAAFRAFRARSIESGLLLGAAILVMLGFVPLGGWLWSGFPEIAEWIMDVLNTTGRRAIIMGAALGAVATGLRVILGIERSHLGAD